jgi:hypothetical protein
LRLLVGQPAPGRLPCHRVRHVSGHYYD